MRPALRQAVRLWARWPLPLSPAAMIIVYHHLDNNGPPLSVSPPAFRDHMAMLADQAEEVRPARLEPVIEDLQRGEAPHRSVVISFDDGYGDVHECGLPALLDHGIPALVYVISGLLDSPGYLSRTQLQELAAAGMDVGAHSRNHLDLRACRPDQLDAEVRGARLDLEDLLGRSVVSFAYPFGRYSEAVRACVRAGGYRSAATVKRGWVDARSDRLALPRTLVPGDDVRLLQATSRGGLNLLNVVGPIRNHGTARANKRLIGRADPADDEKSPAN